MSEDMPKLPWRSRLRWWLYDRCFAYCVRCVDPDADPSEFSLIDDTYFVAIGKDALQEMIKEAPAIAWRFGLD